MSTRISRDCAWVIDESTGTIYALKLPDGRPIALESVAAIIFTDIAEGLDPIAEATARWSEVGQQVAEAASDFVDELVAAGLVVIDALPAAADTTGVGIDPLVGPARAAAPTADEQVGAGPAPFRVLFVCTANICRSAYADVVASAARVPGLEFSSAGTHGWNGQGIDPPMAAQLPAGVDASGHRGRQLTRELVEQADLVVAMASQHRAFIQDEWPGLARKAFVIGQVARELATLPAGATRRQVVEHLWQHRSQESSDSVTDPYRRGPEAAAACAQRIDADLAVILEPLSKLDLGGADERQADQ